MLNNSIKTKPRMQIEFFFGTEVISVTPIVPLLGNSSLAFGDIYKDIKIDKGNEKSKLNYRWEQIYW